MSLALHAGLLASALSLSLVAPNPDRWRLREPDTPHVRRECSDRPWGGSTRCRYEPSSLWRRVRELRARTLDEMTYLLVEATPLQCAWMDALPYARRSLEDLARRRRESELELVESPRQELELRARTLRARYVASSTVLFRVVVQAPAGLTAADHGDFDAVVQALPLAVPANAYARGLWLHRQRGATYASAQVPVCGWPTQDRPGRALRELERASLEEPDRFEAWALRAAILEAGAGGPDPLRELLRAEPARGHPDAALWTVPHIDPAEPVDPLALHEASRLFGEALARHPPAEPTWKLADDPMDRSTIAARRARVHVKLGEPAAAERLYRRVLAFGDAGTWGTLEASFWLAEHALADGDRDAALELYRTADRAWWDFYEVDWLQSGPGAPLRARIDRRLRELDARP